MQTHTTNQPNTPVWSVYKVAAPQERIVPTLPTYHVVIERGLRIPMRDGTELSAMLWRPDAPGPFPALVERGPHRLEERTGPAGEYHAARGYAVLSVGLRGCSGSDGEFSGLIPGSPSGDGYDTIEWTALQSWCNGRIGMICGSISGLTQYQTAVEAPPHLVAQMVREGIFLLLNDDQRGIFEMMGRQAVTVAWTAHQIEHHPAEGRAKAQALVDQWKQEWQQARQAAPADSPFVPVPEMLQKLPIYPNPNFAGVADYYNEWIIAPEQPGWAEAVDLESKAHQTQIPICHFGGWFDSLLPQVLRAFTTMQKAASTPQVRSAQRLIVGPWDHGPSETHGHAIGLLEFGPNAELDFFAFRQRWYDAYLCGQGELSEDPVVWLYLIGADCWLGFPNWPPTTTPVVPTYSYPCRHSA